MATFRRPAVWISTLVVASAVVGAVLLGLVANIFQRKQEAKNPYLRLVDVTEETTDPRPGGSTGRGSSTATAAPPTDPHPVRRHRGAARGEARARPLAQADVRRLRLLARLPRPPRPRLHAGRPGADQAGHRAAAAGQLPALPRLGDPDLPPARRRRCLRRVRAPRKDAVRRCPRRGGGDRLVEPRPRRDHAAVRPRRRRPPGRLRRLPRPEDDAAARDPPRLPARASGRWPRAPRRRRTSPASSAGARRIASSPTTPTATPPARRCARSSAGSATSSTTAARR